MEKKPMQRGNQSMVLICAYIVSISGGIAAVGGVVAILSFGGTPPVYGLVVAMIVLTLLAVRYIRRADRGHRPERTS
ncbi:hypothetical protein ACIA8F_24195 [Streptomyces sp. NPDC051563]|uniref:hypothetical protein n=1 Tax=Streptomyces sp. NPDC051563 TaxID=3365659 RepID=UPI0037B09F79